jgi:hypothetical protein
MKIIRILGIICKRVRRFRSLVLCGFGAGLFATHAAVCAVSWHPLHGLLAGVALLFLALEAQSFANAVRL